MALFGTGEIAPRHAKAIAATDGLSLRAVVSRSLDRASRLAERFGAAALTRADEALARPDVGAIAVVTEHDRHLPLLEAAAAAGRHVVVEKPIGCDVPATRRALDACDAAGVTVACVFQRRFEPALVAVRDAVESGRAGRPIGVELSMVWRRDAAYFESAWRGDPDRAGGGVMMMQAIHFVDAARWLLGEIAEVSGATGRARGLADVEDVAAAAMRFDNGAVGSLFATTAAAGALRNRAAFHFERGSVVLEAGHVLSSSIPADGNRPAPARSSRGGWRHRLARRLPWRLVPREAGPKGTFRDVYRDFVAAVRDGRPPRSSGRDALRSVEAVQALYRAAHGHPTNRNSGF